MSDPVADPSAASATVEEAKRAEGEPAEASASVDLHALPIRAYLDHTVVPTLIQGLSQLAKERPSEPMRWLAQHLLKAADAEAAAAAKPSS
eukprot:PLAT6982.1.p1 GENE.PLAT6982.1~~PLAT6982.1.p1  ORF type:complete len:106 (-),score=46.70 PLAT6982.1:148-420(-)